MSRAIDDCFGARCWPAIAVIACVHALSFAVGCGDDDNNNNALTQQPATGNEMPLAGSGGAPAAGGTPLGGASPAMAGLPATSTGGMDSAGTSSMPEPALDAGDEPLAVDAGMQTADASTPDASATEPMHEDLGEGDGKDVITIGDSWMSLGSAGIQQSLVRISGRPYRTYGVGGTRLLNDQIPNQYASAKRADADIKTVIMTGGGNDILQTGLSSDCANGGDRCRMQLVTIGEALSELWAQMGADGVEDVIHILYSSDAGSGVADSIRDAPELQRRCEEAPLRCHLLPTNDLVNGDLRSDGIHPSNAAYDRIATAVYDLMQSEGMRR